MIAQDKRSAVLGNIDILIHSPAGTAQSPCTEHVIPASAFTETIVCLNRINIHLLEINPRGKAALRHSHAEEHGLYRLRKNSGQRAFVSGHDFKSLP
jgi:hypothetical protein